MSIVRIHWTIASVLCMATVLAVSAEDQPTANAARGPKDNDLKRQIELHEWRATGHAEILRKLKADNRDGQHNAKIAEHERQIHGELNLAFGFKLEFEEQQIKELKTRLTQLEQQVSQRRQLREEIIAQRRNELLKAQTLQWDALESETQKPDEIPVSPVSSALRKGTQVTFREPRGLHVQIGQGRFDPIDLTLPARFIFERQDSRMQRHTLGFTHLPDLPAAIQFTALLDTYPMTPKSTNFVERHTIPIDITADDIRQASTDLVLKFFYVPNVAKPSGVESKTFYSSQLLPGSDPQAEVEKLGAVVVVLQFSRQSERLGVIPPQPKSSEDSNPSALEVPQKANTVTEFDLNIYRQQFDAWTGRINAAKDRVRDLEDLYVRDTTRAKELLEAMAHVESIADEWDRLLKEVTQEYDAKRKEQEVFKLLTEAKILRINAVIEKFSEGETDEKTIRAAIDSRNTAQQAISDRLAELNRINSAINGWQRPARISNPRFSIAEPVSENVYPLREGSALTYLECVTGMKLQLVRFDDLGLWFNAGLRVCDPNGRQYKKGDLIVALRGHTFNSILQAAAAASLNPEGQSNVVLSGGLAGSVQHGQTSYTPVQHFRQPEYRDNLQSATVQFELKLRHPNTNESEALYMSGVCISFDGLVIAALPSKELGTVESIAAIGEFRSAARIAFVEEELGLLLIKLEPEQPRVFPWVKSRLDRPTKNQQLTIPGHGYSAIVDHDCSPEAPARARRFVVVADGDANLRFEVGTRLFTQTAELQGIVVAVAGEESNISKSHESFAIAAVDWQKLVEKYDRSLSQEKPK